MFGLLTPDFIDDFTEFLGDVEAVEHVERGGQHGGDDIQIGFSHVGAVHFDSGSARRSKYSKKLVRDWVSRSLMTPRRRLRPLLIW